MTQLNNIIDTFLQSSNKYDCSVVVTKHLICDDEPSQIDQDCNLKILLALRKTHCSVSVIAVRYQHEQNKFLETIFLCNDIRRSKLLNSTIDKIKNQVPIVLAEFFNKLKPDIVNSINNYRLFSEDFIEVKKYGVAYYPTEMRTIFFQESKLSSRTKLIV